MRGVQWDPSPNFRRGPTAKDRVVLHRTAGAFAGALAWLKDPRSQVSANFVVDNVSGAGHQLVDTADVAWAQGDFNPTSISIEIGGEPTEPVSRPAWLTIAAIVRWATREHMIPLVPAGAPYFTGVAYHGQLGPAGGNHPDCPGPVVLAGLRSLLEDPTMSAYLTDVDERRTLIREWYAAYLGTGPGGREPESEATIDGWLAVFASKGGEAVRTAIYDSAEAQERRARENEALNRLLGSGQGLNLPGPGSGSPASST